MKKNIIMIIIILICSMSLLLVLYYFNSKNIYYISDKIIDNNEITMQLKSGSTYTNLETLNDLDSSKYYRISNETSCSSGTASFYYSNSTNKLKVKVTSNPLKCKIVFEEIREDINIVAIFVNGVEQTTTLSQTANYYLDTTNSSCSGGETITFDNDTKRISITPLTNKTYCNVYLNTGRKVNILVSNGQIVDGYTLTNEIMNGDFENNLNYWGNFNTTYITTDTSNDKCPTNLCPGNIKSMKNTGTAFSQQGMIWYIGWAGSSYTALTPKTDHNYYFSYYGKYTGTTSSVSNHIIGYGSGVPISSNTTVWTKLSAVGVKESPRIHYIALGWVASNGNGVIWMDDIMLIDFTQAFGPKENYYSYKTIIDQMPYFEPYGGLKTDIINNDSKTYTVYPIYGLTDTTIISGSCTVSENTLTVSSGSSDLTCIIKYS